jgi:hypothetical protein
VRTGIDPEAIELSKCERCDRPCATSAIERDPDDPRISLQTFRCVCGESAVSNAAYQ